MEKKYIFCYPPSTFYHLPMLPKPKRLNKKDFEGIRPKVFFRCDLFDVAQAPSLSRKYACIITKKRVKTAIARNTLKRKILTAVREKEKENPKQNKNLLIFYVKAIPKETSYILLQEEIKKVFDTLH